ncbi:MAG TPA: hypothetical protein VGR81_02505 [Candidatus Acidoferrales bacterium]|nr:hypothetical protein [Candidatus Acidoferrales bacterium]
MLDDLQDSQARGLEEYWDIVRRRGWILLLTIFLCWVTVWGLGWFLPETYDSQAEIELQQQQVSPNLVAPNVSASMDEQFQIIENEVLTRSKLQGIIDQFHLYTHQNRLMALFEPADHVEQMIHDIKIEAMETPGRDKQVTAFKVSYSAASPQIAFEVDKKLSELFLQQNTVQQQQSESTTAFFNTELGNAKADLAKQEAQVQAFRAQHLGELPDQLQSNMQILQGLEGQLQNVQLALDRAQQQKLYLQSTVQQYDAAQADLGSGDPNSAVSPPALDKEIKDLQLQLAQERSQYTDNYPDVIALKDQIAKTEKLKKQIEDEIAKNQKSSKTGAATDPAVTADVQNGQPSAMMQIQSQLKANQLEILELQGTQKALEGRIADYQARLNATPAVQQQLTDISRGYDEAQTNYNNLLAKQNESQLATTLQENQQGSQFSLIDPASTPVQPSSPNHILISLGGLGFGIALAIGLTALLELTGARVRREKDLEGLVPARVLVGIPQISTPAEDRRRMLMRWMTRGAAAVIVVVILLGNAYAIYRG